MFNPGVFPYPPAPDARAVSEVPPCCCGEDCCGGNDGRGRSAGGPDRRAERQARSALETYTQWAAILILIGFAVGYGAVLALLVRTP